LKNPETTKQTTLKAEEKGLTTIKKCSTSLDDTEGACLQMGKAERHWK
jgi:hypothetical protein